MPEAGDEQAQRDTRTKLQHVTEAVFRAEVERITGRRVIGL